MTLDYKSDHPLPSLHTHLWGKAMAAKEWHQGPLSVPVLIALRCRTRTVPQGGIKWPHGQVWRLTREKCVLHLRWPMPCPPQWARGVLASACLSGLPIMVHFLGHCQNSSPKGFNLRCWYLEHASHFLPHPFFFCKRKSPGGNLIPTYSYLVSELCKHHAGTLGIYMLLGCVFRAQVTALTVSLG